MKKTIFIAICLSLLSCSQDQSNLNSPITKTNLDFRTILNGWGNTFLGKVENTYNVIVNFQLTDKELGYHLIISDLKYSIEEGVSDSANFTFKASLAHYNKMYRGEMTALTSMGQATGLDSIPLEPDIHKPIADDGNVINDCLFFSQRFFNTSPFDKIILREENSRVIHGGHAIPIFYQKTDEIGVRSAWYQINKGEQVNEAGDTNPFPQYFIITRGNGFVKIGKDTVAVKANEAYFVAPGNDHVFWNESDEPLEMIFLAYGKGA